MSVLKDVERDVLNLLGDSPGRVDFENVTRAYREASKVAARETVAAAERVAEHEVAWQVSSMRSAMPIEVSFTSPSLNIIRAVAREPVRGDLIDDWFDGLAINASNRIRREVRVGLIAGESVPDVVRRLRGTRTEPGMLSVTRRETEAIVRTTMNQATTRARELTYAENDDVVDSVKIVATLDARTSLICMGYDGREFPINDGPRPPFHFNCRTTTVPIIKSWQEMGLKDPTVGTRAALDGEAPADETYPAWLKRQPESVQNMALGPARAALFRTGNVRIDQFVRDGRSLTLTQLSSLE